MPRLWQQAMGVRLTAKKVKKSFTSEADNNWAINLPKNGLKMNLPGYLLLN